MYKVYIKSKGKPLLETNDLRYADYYAKQHPARRIFREGQEVQCGGVVGVSLVDFLSGEF